MAHIKIIYGTGGGNTELICERVAETFAALKHKVTFVKAKVAMPKDMGGADLLILASPTYGHGLLENYMAKLIKLAKADAVDLKGQKCAVISLGNAMYDDDYFLESGRILKKFIEGHNGTVIHDILNVAKSPVPYLEKAAPEWAKAVSAKLKK